LKISYLLAAVALLGAASAAKFTQWNQLESYDFETYVKEYSKPYGNGTKEFVMRRDIFSANLANILKHNKLNGSAKQGVNHFSDMTNEEFNGMLGYKKVLSPKTGFKLGGAAKEREFVKGDLPSRVDWREKGAVTPVKDQGHCGSCWTFAAAETIESHWFLKTGQLVELSEQQIASCAKNPNHCGGTGGCQGGTSQLAFQHVIDNGGITTEWQYSYGSYEGSNYACEWNATTTHPAAYLESFVDLPSNQYWPLMDAVANHGPVAISVDASTWRNYEGGVWDGCDQASPTINHAVQLVGYGSDPAHGDYWLVRNSWTSTWGEGGYIRLKRQEAARCALDTSPATGSGCSGGPPSVTVCGTCGILYDNTYPNVKVPTF
jgi:cathepsin L